VRSQALFEHVKDKPELSVDDMLWWLYDTYKIVVGTRTIRRVFERKGESGNRFKKSKQAAAATDGASDAQPGDLSQAPMPPGGEQYQSPYAPIADMTNHQNNAEMNLAQALSGANYPPPPPAPLELDMEMELPPEEEEDEEEDEETLQLQLQQITTGQKLAYARIRSTEIFIRLDSKHAVQTHRTYRQFSSQARLAQ
jgi:hypothetical protein